MNKPLPDDRQPKDRRGNVIGIGDMLVARRDDGEELRYRVLAVDDLQGSGSVKLECLDILVEQGFKTRWESRYNLWQLYEVESKGPQFQTSDDEEDKEAPYTPTPSDLALYASLRANEVAGAIMQAHVDGDITLETYNKLYAVAKNAQIAAEAVNKRLEEEGKE